MVLMVLLRVRRRAAAAAAVPAAAVLALPPLADGIPLPVLPRAGLAGFRRRAEGVELRVLVQRDGVRGVLGAEDVAAVPAVVFADEEVEVRAAGRRVAGG